jgi:predicted SAM-dependent methyltransferase
VGGQPSETSQDNHSDPEAVLRNYVAGWDVGGINPTDPPALRWKKRLLPARVRHPLRVLATSLQRPLTARKLRRLRHQQPLQLNLGSGYNPKSGWVNVDLMGAPVDLAWDLTSRMPFADSSVDGIYHEHLLEHLSLNEGLELCGECHRVLRPGGKLRIAVPNAGTLLKSYAGTFDRTWVETAPSPMLAVNSLFYELGHRTMYDGELLVFVLKAAGFQSAWESEFGSTELSPMPDDPDRRDGTLFVEAEK